MRPIDAEDLIEHAIVNCESKDFIRKLMDYVADALTVEPEWIPCSERLPEMHTKYAPWVGSYMVSDPVLGYGTPECEDKPTMAVICYEGDDYGQACWFDVCGAGNFDAIAWMPLPAPYGGNE